jgi:hypothetical protein
MLLGADSEHKAGTTFNLTIPTLWQAQSLIGCNIVSVQGVREFVFVRGATHSTLVVESEFHNSWNFYLTLSHAAATIIGMDMRHMEMLQYSFEARFIDGIDQWIEHFMKVVKLNYHNSEVTQNLDGGTYNGFILESLNIHL